MFLCQKSARFDTVNTTPLEVTVMYTKATATYRMKKKEAGR